MGINGYGTDVYTVHEIKEKLGIGINKTYTLVRSGAFLYKRLGKTLLIPKKSFDAWLFDDSEIRFNDTKEDK